jgi:hypothetical protein
MLLFSVSFPDLISYLMDTRERRVWGERQDDFTNNFSIYTYTP